MPRTKPDSQYSVTKPNIWTTAKTKTAPYFANRWRMFQFILTAIFFLLFIFVRVHSPIEIAPYQGYDDELFMSLGRHLADGHWLGRYDAWTLVKGPGYPWFLAFNAWLGTSITLTTALFQCASIGLFFWVFAKMSGMPNLALWGSIFTLWTPAPYMNRIIRDQIYPGQVLLLFAMVFGAFFVARTEKSRRAWALCAGLTAGWLTLTREEGVWILPAIFFIVLFAAYKGWHNQALRNSVIKPIIIMLLSFLATQMAFILGNRIKYHSWVSVETTRYPFKDALATLQSVDSGKRIPYVPVSRQAREAIYAVSPTFDSIKSFLDPVSPSPWLAPTCKFYPQACGEISGGFFFWALRDAVAKAGHYSSPRAASDFYIRLINEVQRACHDGRLKCTPQPIELIPPISKEQWSKLPSSLLVGIYKTTFAILPPDTGPSMGPQDRMAVDLAFLGFPRKSSEINEQRSYHIQGWYYSSGLADWPSVNVNSNGQTRKETLTRIPSPDLVSTFNNAANQRFDYYTACQEPCSLTFITRETTFPPLDLAKMVSHQWRQHIGSETLNIDTIDAQMDSSDALDMRAKLSVSIQTKDAKLYSHVTPWLASAAAIIMIWVLIRSLIARNFTATTALAVTIWILLISRLLLLGLVDISSFPGMIVPYLAPAFVLMSIAICLSLASLKRSPRCL